jgi:hypothetical protein
MPSDEPGTTGQYRIHVPARLAIAGHADRQKKPGTTVKGQEIRTHNDQSPGHIPGLLLFEIEKSLL